MGLTFRYSPTLILQFIADNYRLAISDAIAEVLRLSP